MFQIFAFRLIFITKTGYNLRNKIDSITKLFSSDLPERFPALRSLCAYAIIKTR